MSEPVFGGATERVYSRLPEHFRLADEKNQWTTKRYLSGLLARQDDINTIINRLEYISPEDGEGNRTSDLVDPLRADKRWLPWLSQLLGVKTLVDYENRIVGSVAFNAGSAEPMIAAAQSVLVGERYVKLDPRKIGDTPGSMWDMTITTRNSETLKNMIPEYIATANNLGVFSARIKHTNGSYPKVLSYGSHFSAVSTTDPEWYGGKFLFISNDDNTAAEYEVSTPKFDFPIPSTDTFNFMASIETPVIIPVFLKVDLYDAGGAIIASPTATLTPTGKSKESFFVSLANNANAISAKVTFTCALPFGVGELGMRLEPDAGWVPRTADPVRAIIESGMKPAGIILHHRMYATTWNYIEANLVNFDGWEALGTWDAIEESGI